MKKELYCQYCDKDLEVKYKKTKLTHIINNEEIEVEVMIPYCSKCGNELSDLDLEEERYELVYSKYRQIKKLLTPNEIKRIREKYGLSQRAFSRVLGFSESTINRYELGAIQDNIHNTILVLASNPLNMKILAEQNQGNLNNDEKYSLHAKIDELMSLNSDNYEHDNNQKLNKILLNIENLQSNINKMDKRLEQMDKKVDNYSREFKRRDLYHREDWPIENTFRINDNSSKFNTILHSKN